jgi:hypothetical protein
MQSVGPRTRARRLESAIAAGAKAAGIAVPRYRDQFNHTVHEGCAVVCGKARSRLRR